MVKLTKILENSAWALQVPLVLDNIVYPALTFGGQSFSSSIGLDTSVLDFESKYLITEMSLATIGSLYLIGSKRIKTMFNVMGNYL